MLRPEKFNLHISHPLTVISREGWNQCHDAFMSWLASDECRDEILGASAQGYCTDRNSHKIVDPDLLEDIATAIQQRLTEGKWITGETAPVSSAEINQVERSAENGT